MVFPKGYSRLLSEQYHAGKRMRFKTAHRIERIEGIEQKVLNGEPLNDLEAKYYDPVTGEWSVEWYENRMYYRKGTKAPMRKVVDPCYECGKTTVFGSGRFVNRVGSDCNPNEGITHTDLVMVGDWFCCGECDAKFFPEESLDK